MNITDQMIYKKAFEWFSKSANNGCKEGQSSLTPIIVIIMELEQIKILRKHLNGIKGLRIN